jgi:GT2 family glycosyltransferase
MQNNTLNISVVIATYNRSVSLMETMQALVQQDFHPARFEVIVVNDGSTDQTIEKLKEFKALAPFQVRFFSQANRGPAAARNKGIMEAAGNIIAFTDDDCVPDHDWLTSIYQFFEKNNHVGLQGSTYTDVDKITPLTHQIDNVNGNPSVPTCNAAYLRSALLNANGFDEEFPFPHNEDADLAWRIAKQGALGFHPDMKVYHPTRIDKFEKIATRMKIMESEFRLFAKNPESYKRHRAKSPWLNIYWQIGIKTQWYYLRSRIRFITRPTLFFQGLAITFLWWFDLLRLLPTFIKASRASKIQG